MQNIHLVRKWLPTLEKKLESTAVGSHESYRVYMSAEPAPTPEGHIIPQGILESSIKITNEPPTGMQANLHKALENFNQVIKDFSFGTYAWRIEYSISPLVSVTFCTKGVKRMQCFSQLRKMKRRPVSSRRAHPQPWFHVSARLPFKNCQMVYSNFY